MTVRIIDPNPSEPSRASDSGMNNGFERINQLLEEGRAETDRVRRESPETDMVPFYELLLNVDELDIVISALTGHTVSSEEIAQVRDAIEAGVEGGPRTVNDY